MSTTIGRGEGVFDQHIAPQAPGTITGLGEITTAQALAEQGRDVSGDKPALSSGFLDHTGISDLLKATDQTIQEAESAEEEVSRKIEERQSILDKVNGINTQIDAVNSNARKKLGVIDSWLERDEDDDAPAFEAQIFSAFRKANVLDVPKEDVATVTEVISRIQKLRAIVDKTPEVEGAIARLEAIEGSFYKRLEESLLESRRDVVTEQDAETRGLEEQRDDLVEELDELMQDGRIARRLEILAYEAREADTVERLKEIKQATSFIISGTKPAIKRVNEALTDTNPDKPASELLRDALDESKSAFDKARRMIREQIIERILERSDNTQIKEVTEIAPWLGGGANRYFRSRELLKSPETKTFIDDLEQSDPKEAQKLRARIQQALSNNDILFGVVETKQVKGSGRLNSVHQAFVDRKAKDQEKK